jgi:hypothetical protein
VDLNLLPAENKGARAGRSPPLGSATELGSRLPEGINTSKLVAYTNKHAINNNMKKDRQKERKMAGFSSEVGIVDYY